MNIDESKSLLGWVSLNKLYIDTHNECDYHNIHTAIETLLTAYEKEKEKNKELEKIIQILEAKPYTAYTLYGDILHESDEIAQMLKEVLEKE